MVLFKSLFKFALLIIAAVILTATTFVFGALPMRVVRKVYGRWVYWASLTVMAGTLLVAGAPLYAFLVASLSVTVGVYVEIEEHGGSVFNAGLTGILSAVGASAIVGGLWLQSKKLHLLEEVRAQVSILVEQMTKMNPNIAVNAETALQQLPSVVLMGLVMAIAISLIGEFRVTRWIKPTEMNAVLAERVRLVSFRVPDAFIWLAIVAIFGAFYRHGSELFEIVSVNVLNVLVLVFFFQGLAIVAQAFRVFRIGVFWRNLWYIVLVLQLFLIVSLIGFVDFWLEFRDRMTRKPVTTNKGF